MTSSSSAEGGEVSEMEIITNYKSQNLFDSLKKLKAAEVQAKEREEILNLADEPILPEFKNLSEQDKYLVMLKKIDSYQSRLEERLKAADNELKARKNVVKDLEDSCVFYNAQYKDVKKVANAYMAYGRRLKNVESKLSEKMLLFSSQGENSSTCFSERNSCASPVIGTSSFHHDNTSMSGTSSKPSPGSVNEKGQDGLLSSDNLKSHSFSWSKISRNSLSDSAKRCENELEETLENRLGQSPKPKFSKLAEIFAETKSDSEKQMSPELALTRTSDLKFLSCPNIQNENIADLQITADQQNEVPKNTGLSSAETSSNQDTNILDCLNEKEITENDNEIEFLLEESYDTKKAKSNMDVKRRIELPLQSKGRNICTNASEKKHSDSNQPLNIREEEENKSSEDMTEGEMLN
ncbi:regulation of nuclear pre-mRNA domain-containing protein 2-like isoform X1 [Argiope bruennichi]|uniref:regulation of nuclear pre-mRNA domain-containing protein 2-like isoform X1 n=2 Tax=Argiope bruennichi TaxID=94029 RepID=UPI0024942B61|nr:regulation of nuclear pre-mRNA domain-containing protein 2-like isoform X1 [Argiope bruennichi]